MVPRMTSPAPSAALAAKPVVLVRYGEIALKGGNRQDFERALARQVEDALEGLEFGRVLRPQGRLVVSEPADVGAVAERTARVFGVTSVSPALAVKPDLDAIRAAGVRLVGDALARQGSPSGAGRSFRVAARRADKSFPVRSNDLTLLAAAAVHGHFPDLRVRMKGADVELGIEVRPGQALLYADRLPGPGGLPIGTLGKAVVLFSGGIDSPVAAWLAMKRGLKVELLHFHSAEFVGGASREKAVDLARALSRWCGYLKLHVAPFSAIQVAIRDGAPEPYRTLLYRRAMNRVAARVADSCNARCLVTGESLGQVASQTVENLRCIEDSADRLLLRPLVTFDKEETIQLAERIGTFAVSARPAPDCCTLFQPLRPKIRGDVEECHRIEAGMELAPLVEASAAAIETIRVKNGAVIG